jgi:hypothetical protein
MSDFRVTKFPRHRDCWVELEQPGFRPLVYFLSCSLVLICLQACTGAYHASEREYRTGGAGGGLSQAGEEGFVPLFSETALKDWRQCGPGRFVVTNGIATGEGGMGL